MKVGTAIEGIPYYKDLTVLIAESGVGGYACAQDLAAQKKGFPVAI